MYGTLDYFKTAKLIVREERLSVERRYKMACINCLEKEARRLLPLIPADRQREFMDYDLYNLNMIHDDRRILILYFTHILSGQVKQLNELYETRISRGHAISINEYLFKVVSEDGSPRTTVEYCYKKLSHGERRRLLVEHGEWLIHRNSTPTCTFLYALTLLNERQRSSDFVDVFQKYSCTLLLDLLKWPRQPLFMEAAERGWEHMEEEGRAEVLAEIIRKVWSCQSYDYARLFWECWRKLCRSAAGADFKLRYLRDFDHIRGLIDTEREEFITLALRQAPSQLLQQLLCDDGSLQRVLMDASVISDAALMECKEAAALVSSNHPGDEEKRLRKKWLSRLVNIVYEYRAKNY